MNLELELLNDRFAVCQVPDLSLVDLQAEFLFLARTDAELSVVCPEARTPANAAAVEAGWLAFRVAGTLDFSLVGILAFLASALADAGISLYAVSTYNTDYVLVKADCLDTARAALTAAGCRFAAN